MTQKKYEMPIVSIIITDLSDVIRTSGQEEGVEWPNEWNFTEN